MLVLFFSVLALLGAAQNDPCACTGDNSLIPKKKKKFSQTDYGKKCGDWDMEHRYCTNPRSLLEANRACWCPKSWCWVSSDCPSAIESTFFKDSGLYFSYDACGNSADACFGEDDDMEKEWEKAITEDHSDDDEHTIQDIMYALVALTINVNTLTKVVNSLSQQVSTLNGEMLVLEPDAAIDPDLVPPVILPTENIADVDGEGFTESWWGESECPIGYKTIKSGNLCDSAGPALGYTVIDNNNAGDMEKKCVFDSTLAGFHMTKTYGGENQKMLCQKMRKDVIGRR